MPHTANLEKNRSVSDRRRVLLTTVCRPFGKNGEGDSVGAELFHAQVKRCQGVAILSSMIVGFPNQDRHQVLQDLRQLQAFGPALWQILIYFAFPGKPLHESALSKDLYHTYYRYNPDYRKFDGFSMHFKHRNFSPAELENL
jgi:hypothetical protein